MVAAIKEISHPLEDAKCTFDATKGIQRDQIKLFFRQLADDEVSEATPVSMESGGTLGSAYLVKQIISSVFISRRNRWHVEKGNRGRRRTCGSVWRCTVDRTDWRMKNGRGRGKKEKSRIREA